MRIKADYRQFIAEDAGLLAIMSVLAGAVPMAVRDFDRMTAVAVAAMGLFLLTFLIIRYVMLVSVKWLIEEEMVCRVRGVFSKETDYIEMYRITDYKESQSFLQRLLGVKTVILYSTDLSDNVSGIFGVPAELDLISIIRNNVEKCKKGKRIYEIANH